MLTTGEITTNALLKHPRELFFGQTRRPSKFQLVRAVVRAGSTSPGSGEPVLLGGAAGDEAVGLQVLTCISWGMVAADSCAWCLSWGKDFVSLPSSSQPASICVPCREVRRTAGEVMGRQAELRALAEVGLVRVVLCAEQDERS